MRQHFELNTKGKDYVVGDIHGCFAKLQQCLDEMGFNEATDRLFCVGDMVDGGPDSEAFMDWLAKPWFFSVLGNHEQMMLDWDGRTGREDPYIYRLNGGGWFLELDEVTQKMYANEVSKLPTMISVDTPKGKCGIVHADIFGDWDQHHHELSLLWGRDRIAVKAQAPVTGVHKVYCGHTPVKDVVTLGNVSYIDTGACFGGKFTIMELGM